MPARFWKVIPPPASMRYTRSVVDPVAGFEIVWVLLKAPAVPEAMDGPPDMDKFCSSCQLPSESRKRIHVPDIFGNLTAPQPARSIAKDGALEADWSVKVCGAPQPWPAANLA